MSRKNLGPLPGLYPMPVLMIATYNTNETVNVMTAAWGQICSDNKLALFLAEEHKTTANILRTESFTVSPADIQHIKEADYFGMVSGNTEPDKFLSTGLSCMKSEFVDAPVLTDLPITLECTLAEVIERDYMYCVIGNIINTSADESVLNNSGDVDPSVLNAVSYNEFDMSYYHGSEFLGKSADIGTELM